MTSPSVSKCLAQALNAVVPVLDIALERPQGAAPPGFCTARGFADFLAALSADELVRCETEGLATRLPMLGHAPPALVELGRELLEVTRLPARVGHDQPTPRDKQRAVSERKQSEIEALLAVVAPLASRAERIVDVGAGRGHLTRIAAERFDREAVGIDRVPERLTEAMRLSAGTRASFLLLDASREALTLEARDLAIGLHACGALGDRLIQSAAEARCDVVLVSCCLQKIEAPARLPSSAPAMKAGLVLSRETLGLSNLTSRARGVESTLSETMDARRKRWALARLLHHRGHPVLPGEEMRGLNRRMAHRPFTQLVQRALLLRNLTPATPSEINEHERHGAIEFEQMRRFALPRAMMARPLEVTVAFDRAALLEENGYEARVVEVFDMAVTPRNLAIIGARS